MNPCRPDCPSGDCANCVGFGQDQQPARCIPAKADGCTRRAECQRHHLQSSKTIDASVALRSLGWCPMFKPLRQMEAA